MLKSVTFSDYDTGSESLNFTQAALCHDLRFIPKAKWDNER